MSVDLDRYFARIGYAGPGSPELSSLRGIITAHTQSIPFENFNPLLGWPVPLDLPALEQKLVCSGRGGYCFEQNGLLRAVLLELGFDVQGLIARVLWRQPTDAQTARSHMVLRLELEGQSYIVDVGFGVMTLTAPLPLLPDVTQITPHEPFRLTTHPLGLDLQAQLPDGFRTLYRLSLEPAFQIDYEVSNYYTSTNPSSHFRQHLMMARVEPWGRMTLIDNAFTVHRLGHAPERRVLQDPGELERVIREQLKLQLPAGSEVQALLTRLASAPAA